MRGLANSKYVLILATLLLLSTADVSLTLMPVPLHAMPVASPLNVPQTQHTQRGQRTSAVLPSSTPLDWPEFLGDVARDGDRSSNTMLSKQNAGSLVPVSGPAFTTTGAVMSSPAIYQGILYYAANAPVGKLQVSTMYAVNAMSGQTIWSEKFPNCGKSKIPQYVLSSPAVTIGQVNGASTPEVFIGWGSPYTNQGCIYDFEGPTGALIWSYVTAQSVFSSPAIMSTTSGSIVAIGDNDDYVHAFSVDYSGSMGGKGVQIWSYNTRTDPPPHGYKKYCWQNSEKCGDAVWSSPAEGLILVNGTAHHYAYFGVGAGKNEVGRVEAIDLDTIQNNSPALVWSFWDLHPSYDNDFATNLVYSDQNGYASRVFTGMRNGDMYALDAASGKMYFDFSTPAHLGNIQMMLHSTGTLVNLNGTLELIFGSGCAADIHYPTCAGPSNGYGYIWAIDALSTNSSGTLLWQSQDFGGDMVSSLAVVNQGTNAVVFILGPWYPGTTTHGDLLAIDPSNGAIIAAYPIFNQSFGAISSPAIYGGRIYVTVGYTLYTQNNPGGGGLAAFRCATCP